MRGLVQTINAFVPLTAATSAGISLPYDKTALVLVDGVARDAYAGHDASFRCWSRQAAFICDILGLSCTVLVQMQLPRTAFMVIYVFCCEHFLRAVSRIALRPFSISPQRELNRAGSARQP